MQMRRSVNLYVAYGTNPKTISGMYLQKDSSYATEQCRDEACSTLVARSNKTIGEDLLQVCEILTYKNQLNNQHSFCEGCCTLHLQLALDSYSLNMV